MAPAPSAPRRVDSTFHPVSDPEASRPYMPGYGTLPADQGTGLLPWSWAEERLARSHDYWLGTVMPSGAPHLMPVWAVWHDGRLWFSSANGSRKARNLATEPRCTMSTDDPLEPVVVQGRAERHTAQEQLERVLAAENAKYGTDYGLELVDPAFNSVFSLLPEWVFTLDAKDFTGSPTRFVFAPESGAPSGTLDLR
jgi:nitroimidazol reductase NimA-like FMN-containing flavoprotein (pyridoxamine 5'-phosphate oxidase superfamily)